MTPDVFTVRLDESTPDIVTGGDIQSGYRTNAAVQYAHEQLFPPFQSLTREQMVSCCVKVLLSMWNPQTVATMYPILLTTMLPPPGTQHRADCVTELSRALHTRWDFLTQLPDLDAVIAADRELSTFEYGQLILQATVYTNLGGALSVYFNQTMHPAALDEAIDYFKKAQKLLDEDICLDLASAHLIFTLDTIAFLWLVRMQLHGSFTEADNAVTYCKRAANLTKEYQPDQYGHALQSLGRAMYFHMGISHSSEDTDHAIKYLTEALVLHPKGHPEHFTTLGLLGASLGQRFGFGNNKSDCDMAIAYLEEAADYGPSWSPDIHSAQSALAEGYNTRFEHYGNPVDLDNCIMTWHRLLERPLGNSAKALFLERLGTCLHKRYSLQGGDGNYKEAMECYSKAVSLTPHHIPLYITSLVNMGMTLSDRFKRLGNSEDVETALIYFRKALELSSPSDKAWSTAHSGLGQAYVLRFQAFFDYSDLDASIESYSKALDALPKDDVNYYNVMGGLGHSIYRKYLQTGKVSHLNKSIELMTKTLESDSNSDVNNGGRHIRFTALAMALRSRAQRLNTFADLSTALKYHREAIEKCPLDHTQRSRTVSAYASTLQFQLTAEKGYEDSLEMSFTPLSHKGFLPGLQEKLQQRMQDAAAKAKEKIAARRQTQVDHMIDLLREAVHHPKVLWAPKLAACTCWQSVASEHKHPSAVEAYKITLTLVYSLILGQRTLHSQHKKLANDPTLGDIPTDATHVSIEVGNLTAAIEFMEIGKGIMISQLTNYSVSIGNLEQVDKELARKFTAIVAQMHDNLTSESQILDLETIDKLPTNQFQFGVDAWEAVLKDIRGLPGFGDFLRFPAFDKLQSAASHGPVILPNISVQGSYAIILLSQGNPVLVPLPTAKLDWVMALSESLDGICHDELASSQQRNAAICGSSHGPGILGELWNHLVGPIIAVLESYLGQPEDTTCKRRIWWCLSSSLWRLPIHAAGIYKRDGRKLLDHYISSYTPSLTALSTSLKSPPLLPTNPRLLLVSHDSASGQEPLDYAAAEVQSIQDIIPYISHLSNSEATPEAILSNMELCPFVHFICHGIQDHENPFYSRFCVHGDLSLFSLLKQKLPLAKLAILSTCQSATGDVKTLNEGLHLTGSMQFAGYPSVVGTMWEASDSVAPTFSAAFYRHLLRNGADNIRHTESAEALMEAVKCMRRLGVEARDWVNYVHYGA